MIPGGQQEYTSPDGETFIQLLLNKEELRVLVFAVESWSDTVNKAPLMEQQVSRSEAMRGRRAASRFRGRILSLAKAYRIEM